MVCAQCHAVLEKYIATKLVAGGSAPTGADSSFDVSDDGGAAPAEVAGFLRYAGVEAAAAAAAAAAMRPDGFDTVAALRAGSLEAWEMAGYGLSDADAERVLSVLGGEPPQAVREWLGGVSGVDAASASACAAALAADGFDSLDAIRAGSLSAADLTRSFQVPADAAAAIASAMAQLKVGSAAAATGSGGDGSGGGDNNGGDGSLGGHDPAAIPLDDLLLNALVKLAGGIKKGATFATHMSLADLKGAMKERMT